VLTSNGTGTAAGVSCNLIANSTTGLIKFTPESPVILSPGQELIFNFTARVNSSADFEGCNIASYNATDKANGMILTRYSQKCLTVLKPKANINKISDRQASEPGGIVEFTLMLENDGNSPLYNVTINDTLTSGWEFIETTQNVTGMTINETSTGSATNNTVIFSGITLNKGQRSIIKYTSMITDDVPEGSSENCANVTGYDNGSTPYSDGYCMEITVYKPSLEVVKDVSQHDIEPGSEPMVTLIIQNPTYATVYNITVKEFLPRGFNYTTGSAKLDGVPVDDPNITGIETFDCGSTTTG